MTDTLRRFAAAAAIPFAMFAGRSTAHAAQLNRETSLRIAIVLDRSGTYRGQSDQAVHKATQLLERLAQTRVHRWEAGNDRIVVISLDALPEVLWRGTLEQLRLLDHAAWNERLAARRDFEHCTDVAAAFDLAARELDTDAAFADRYIFAFTDLIDEPPGASVRSCKTAMHHPSAAFPWTRLASTSVSVFWVPADQVLRWRRAASDRGLEATFVLHSVSESATVSIPPLPRPKIVIDPAEQAENRARFLGYGAQAAKALGYIALGGAGLVVGLVVATRLGRGRRRTPKRAARHGAAAANVHSRPVLVERSTRSEARRSPGGAASGGH
jgi:hypothetical protein